MESSPWFADVERIRALADFAEIKPQTQILDVGAGPGFVVGLAFVVRYAVGVDLTLEMTSRPNRSKHETKLDNAFSARGDVEYLPFADESFDVVIARAALHHFPRPTIALQEMRRVCKNEGQIVIEDTLSSENAEENDVHNQIERLRDPTHVRMYSSHEIRAIARACNLVEVKRLEMRSERDFEDWMHLANPPLPKRQIVREMMLRSIPNDIPSLGPRIEYEKPVFTYRRVMSSLTKTPIL